MTQEFTGEGYRLDRSRNAKGHLVFDLREK